MRIMKKKYSTNYQFCLRQALLVVIGLHVTAGLGGRYSSNGQYRNQQACTYRYHATPLLYVSPVGGIKSSHDDILDKDEGTTIKVSYEGQSCDIKVLPNESILSALERQSLYVQSQLTALPDM
jgi:hypothetical protein